MSWCSCDVTALCDIGISVTVMMIVLNLKKFSAMNGDNFVGKALDFKWTIHDSVKRNRRLTFGTTFIYIIYLRIRHHKLLYPIGLCRMYLFMHGLTSSLLKFGQWQVFSSHIFMLIWLTHWGRDKMAAIFQTTFSNGFSWIKMYEFGLTFHWSLFLGVQLIIFQHLFR